MEKELRTLLIKADEPENDAGVVKSESRFIVVPNLAQGTRRSKIMKSVLYIAAAPFMLIAVIGYLVLFFLISIVTNSIRFVVSKVRKTSFQLEWADPGSAGIAGTIGQLRVMVYPNDHPPPHFHVVTDTYNAKFDIETCELLGGSPPSKHVKVIKGWHANKVELLREKWRVTRPGDIQD